MSREPALQKAIDAMPTRHGKLAALAEALGIFPQAISQWKKVPTTRVLAVERITGIPKEVLRPDIYPAEQGAAE